MSHSFNLVRKLHHSVVRPSRHGIRLIAVIIAATVGLSGSFMEENPQIKALEAGDVVEQIQATIERRESIKEIEEIINLNSLEQFTAA